MAHVFNGALAPRPQATPCGVSALLQQCLAKMRLSRASVGLMMQLDGYAALLSPCHRPQ